MRAAPTSVRDVFLGVSARLGALAATLSSVGSARLVSPSLVSGELHELVDLTASGLSGLAASTNARASNLVPAITDAIDGMAHLASRIEAAPSLSATSATVDAIAGWAGLTAGATIALRRR
jgi:hypothetical protein